MNRDRSRTYRRLTPVNQRKLDAQAKRSRRDSSPGIRRLQAPVEPDALAFRSRSTAVIVVFFLAWLLVIGRSAYLAVGPDERLAQRLPDQQQRVISVAPRRGGIVDRLGRPLAISLELESIWSDPKFVEDAKAASELLGPLLNEEAEIVEKKLSRANRRFVWLARQVPSRLSEAVRQLDIPGIYMTAEAHRDYPSGSLAAPILGFTGSDGQGLEGLEAKLEGTLRGDSYQYRVFRDGRRRAVNHDAVLGRRSTEGNTAVLTLDHAIQHRAEVSLAAAVEEHEAAAGWAVSLDAKTGAILAMVSLPSYDPNHFRGTNGKQRRNRAVSDSFEPGSTMKPFVLAEVLEMGLSTPDELIYCERGTYRIGRQAIHDAHPEEKISFAQVLKVSSNIGTVKLAEKVGPAGIEAALRRYGFGAKTGIDVYGEEAGILRKSEGWTRMGFANHCFGQGMAVTAIQLTAAFAALVNGGLHIQPYLVAERRDRSGRVIEDHRPQGPFERVLSEETSAQMRELLGGVVEEGGTGTRAALDEYTVGGKTGTAQKPRDGGYPRGLYVSSFIGFAPLHDPRVVTLVVLDEPRGKKYYGGTVAGPVFRDITRQALRELGVPPDREVKRPILMAAEASGAVEPGSREGVEQSPDLRLEPLETEGGAIGSYRMPDLRGLAARDAVRLLVPAGLEVELDGSGRVLMQEPEAGEPVSPGDPVRLALATRAVQGGGRQ